VLFLGSRTETTDARDWAQKFCGQDPIFLYRPLNIRDITALLPKLQLTSMPPGTGIENPRSDEPARLVVGGSTTAEAGAVPENEEPPPFPDQVDCDGYRTIREIRTTGFSRVFLAQLKFSGDLVILKLLRPENQEQSDAMRIAITLHKNKPEAQKVMVPIHHANTW